MNEDMNMNEEIEVVNPEDIVVHDEGTTEGSGGAGLLGKVLVIGGAAFAAGVAAAPKIRSWNEARKVKSLEKKGYLIVKKDPDENDSEAVDVEEIDDEE